MKAKICNKDCLNCPFDDCINDEMDADDYRESEHRDKLFASDDERKRKERNRQTYLKNKEQYKARSRAYYQKHKEEVKEYQQRYRADELNRKRRMSMQRQWEKRNRGIYGQKQKILRTERLRLGMTQKEVAKFFGVSSACISQWERGIMPCKVEEVLKKIYEAGVAAL